MANTLEAIKRYKESQSNNLKPSNIIVNNSLDAINKYKAKFTPPTVSPETEQRILGRTLSTKDIFDKVNKELNLKSTLKPTLPVSAQYAPETKQKLLTNNLTVKGIFDKVNQNLKAPKKTSMLDIGKAGIDTKAIETMMTTDIKRIKEKYKNIPNYQELPEYQQNISEYIKKYPESKSVIEMAAPAFEPEKTKKTLPYLSEKAKSGLYSFAEGIRKMANLKLGEKLTPAITKEEAVSSEIERQRKKFIEAETENVSPALKLGGDVVEGITRMIPTIIMGSVNTPIALTQMGFSVAGNSMDEALEQGATKEQALTYGVLSGSLEAAVEGLVGGLPFLKGFSDKAINAVLKPIKNRIARVLAGRVIDAGGEALEEVISGVIDPYLRRATFNKKTEFPKLQELMYESGVAALISGALGIPATVMQLSQPKKVVETQAKTLQRPIEKQTLPPVEKPREIIRPAQLLPPQSIEQVKTLPTLKKTEMPETSIQIQPEERRINQALRQKIEQMTPEERTKTLYQNPVTGIMNKRAYNEVLNNPELKKPIQTKLDVDGLKWFNDNLGEKAGDKLLITVADSLNTLGIDDVFHTGGDEFYAQFNTEQEANEAMGKVRNVLTNSEIEVKLPNGDTRIFKGGNFSYGTGQNPEIADQAMQRNKLRRETEGLRATRGERPTGLVEVDKGQRLQTERRGGISEVAEKPTLKIAQRETLQQPKLKETKQPTKETAIKDVQNKINELETEMPKFKINLQLFAKKRLQKYKKLLDDLQKKGVTKSNIEEVKKLMDIKDSITDLKKEWETKAKEMAKLRLKTQKEKLTQKFKLKEAKQKEQLKQSKFKAIERKTVNKEVRGMIDKLKKVGKELKYMRPEYRDKIKDLLDTIDYKVKYRTGAKLEQLTKLKQYIEDNPDNNIPDYVLKDLDILSKKTIKDIGLEEFRSIHNAVMHLVHLEKLKNALIWGQKYKDAKEVSDEAISNVLKDKDILVDPTIIDTSKPEYRGNLAKEYYYNSLNPETLTFMSDNKTDGIIKKVLYDDFLDGYSEQLKFKSDAYNIFKDFLESLGNDIRTWSRHFNKNIKDYVEIEISDGRKLKMTKAERAYIYAATFDKDAQRSMIKGGISTKNNLSQVFKLNEADLKAIENSLSKEEKEFVQLTQEYFKDFAADKMNERFLELNGYELIPEKKGYIPIYRHSDYINRDTLKPRGKTINATLEGIGYLKERVKDSKPIVIEDMFRVLVDHIEKISAYYGMAKPLRNAKMLMNDINFKNAYRRTGQTEIYKQLEKYLKDVEDNSIDMDFIDKLSYNILNKFSTYALGANPFTVLKQYTSYALEAAEINPKYLIKAQFTKSDLDEIKKYSPILADRIEGNVSLELGEIGKISRLRRLFGNYRSIPQILTKGIVMADRNIIAKTWNAVKMEVKDNNPNLKGEDFLKKVASRTEEIIRHTNSSSNMFDRSAIGRSKSAFAKNVSMFTSQTNIMLNKIIRSIHEWNISDKTAKDLIKLMKSLSLTLIIATLLEKGVDKLRARLKGKKEKQNIGLDLLEGFFDKFYGLGQAFRVFRSRLERGKYFGYDYTLPVIQLFDQLINIGVDLNDMFDKIKTQEVYVSGDKKGQLKWKKSAASLSNSLISVLGKLTGVPVDQIKGIGQMLAPKEEPEKQEKVKIKKLKKSKVPRLKKP